MPQINLLPWREQARRAKKVRFALMLAAVTVFALLILIGMHGRYDRFIKYQEGRNVYITDRLGSAQGTLNKLNSQKKEQEIVMAKLQFIIGLRLADYKVVELLNYMTVLVPEAVSFTKIIRIDDQVTIIGRAKSNLQITQLMKNIENNAKFEQPELSLITSKENSTGEERIFQLLFKQKE